jgi:hypothetical protein
MNSFDFGVSLSLYLSGVVLVLCVVYGVFYWNRDGEKRDAKSAKQWDKDEQKINEEL